MGKLGALLVSAMLLLAVSLSVVPEVEAQPPKKELIIISPHAKPILDSFKKAFELYARDVLKIDVVLSYSYYSSEACYKLAREWAGKPKADIWWGGGVDLFVKATAEGLLEPHKAKDWGKVPTEWFGIPAKDPHGHWTGYALSGFGLAFHTSYLKKYDLPEPRTWIDLLNPAYRGHILMCTPKRSGSTHMMVEIVLQGIGWDEGWGYWRKMAVNVGIFTAKSHDVIVAVNRGEYGIGLVVDYFGFESAVAGYPVKFVYPEDYSFVNPDSIAILKGAPNLDVAKAFVDYVISEEGQKLSMGIEQRGVKCPSPRFTIRPDIPLPPYLPDITKLKMITYDAELAIKRWALVNKIYEETIEWKHGILKTTWKTIEDSEVKLAELEAKGWDVKEALVKLAEAKGRFCAGDYAEARKLAELSVDLAKAPPPYEPPVIEIPEEAIREAKKAAEESVEVIKKGEAAAKAFIGTADMYRILLLAMFALVIIFSIVPLLPVALRERLKRK